MTDYLAIDIPTFVYSCSYHGGVHMDGKRCSTEKRTSTSIVTEIVVHIVESETNMTEVTVERYIGHIIRVDT